MLLHLYSAYSQSSKGKGTSSSSYSDRPLPNLPNGHARGPTDRQAQQAQEFELEALMSEDDEDPESGKLNGRPRQG